MWPMQNASSSTSSAVSNVPTDPLARSPPIKLSKKPSIRESSLVSYPSCLRASSIFNQLRQRRLIVPAFHQPRPRHPERRLHVFRVVPPLQVQRPRHLPEPERKTIRELQLQHARVARHQRRGIHVLLY